MSFLFVLLIAGAAWTLILRQRRNQRRQGNERRQSLDTEGQQDGKNDQEKEGQI